MRRDKLKFIPYSNGFHKIRNKREIHPIKLSKTIFLIVLSVFMFGVVYQFIINKIDKSKFQPTEKYLRIDGKKYYFNSTGEGKPTILFESDIGMGMNQWKSSAELIKQKYDVKTFCYDRQGYGFSEYAAHKTPEEEARYLRMILKKVGVSGPYILVGEGYGTLILSNFQKLYPDLVCGAIYINPINETALKNDKNYLKQYSSQKLFRSMQRLGSYCGINDILSKTVGLDIPEGLDKGFDEYNLKEYKKQRTKTEFNLAYYNELKNIIEGKSDAQEDGLFKEVPFNLIITEGANKSYCEDLTRLGHSDLTKVKYVETESDIVSLDQPDVLLEGLKFILDLTKKNDNN